MIPRLHPRILRPTTTLLSNTKNVSTTSIGPLAVAISSLRPEVQRLHKDVTEFVRENIFPIEQEIRDWNEKETWKIHPKIEELKSKAKSAGLWNFFVPVDTDPEQNRYGL